MGAVTVYWEEDPNRWDQLLLAGEIWPGIATITGDGIKRKLDVKKRKGADGASIRDEGMEPARINIVIQLFTSAQWESFQRRLPDITPRRKGGLRKPVTIGHPLLSVVGITTVYIEAIPMPDLDKSTGIMTVTIQAIEWIPKPKPLRRGKGGGSRKPNDEVPKDEDLEALEKDMFAQERIIKESINAGLRALGRPLLC